MSPDISWKKKKKIYVSNEIQWKILEKYVKNVIKILARKSEENKKGETRKFPSF